MRDKNHIPTNAMTKVDMSFWKVYRFVSLMVLVLFVVLVLSVLALPILFFGVLDIDPSSEVSLILWLFIAVIGFISWFLYYKYLAPAGSAHKIIQYASENGRWVEAKFVRIQDRRVRTSRSFLWYEYASVLEFEVEGERVVFHVHKHADEVSAFPQKGESITFWQVPALPSINDKILSNIRYNYFWFSYTSRFYYLWISAANKKK
ncbi:MAG: hypothetical protein KatS3mg025_1887 [Bacteroidia bacterium]|nr:MAG: hypothetical protein KatS3mg025_1887 [Bacteroidia bacterium]